jgi:hypothetical protein
MESHPDKGLFVSPIRLLAKEPWEQTIHSVEGIIKTLRTPSITCSVDKSNTK